MSSSECGIPVIVPSSSTPINIHEHIVYKCKRRCGMDFDGNYTEDAYSANFNSTAYYSTRALTKYQMTSTVTSSNSIVPGANISLTISDGY